jgi:hypothetical protein
MTWAKDEQSLNPRPHSIFNHPAPRLCLRDACSLAALGRHLEVLKWLHSAGCPWGVHTCHAAAESGHLEVLKWLHNTGCPWDSSTCSAAARGGHLELLQWLHNQGCPWAEWNVFRCRYGRAPGDAAVGAGAPMPWNEGAVRANAAHCGHVDILRWMDEQGGA